MNALTDSERQQNRAQRIRSAADESDGLTVRLTNGEVLVVSRSVALSRIEAGQAELAE